LGDSNFPVDIKHYLEKYAFTWHLSPSIGQDAGYTLSFNQFFWYLIPLLKIGVSLELAQAVAYTFLYYLPFLFCYLLFRRGLRIRFFPALLASLFYVLNPFYIGQWYVPIPHNPGIFITIPLISYLLARFWDKPVELLWLSFLTFFFLAFANANPAFTAIAFVCVFTFGAIYSLYEKSKYDWGKYGVNCLLIIASFILAGSWWLLNTVFTVSSAYGEFSGKMNLVEWLQSVSSRATLLNVISLRFTLPFTREHLLVTYLPFFFSSSVNLISFIPFFLVLGALIILCRNARKLTFWLFVFLAIAIFLTKALNPPFGNLFLFLFQKMPFFGIFKSAPEKFGIFYVFWLTLILGIATEKLEGKFKIFFLVGLGLSLLVFAYPLYTLQLVTPLEIGQFKITPFYQEPENYRQLREYLDSNPE